MSSEGMKNPEDPRDNAGIKAKARRLGNSVLNALGRGYGGTVGLAYVSLPNYEKLTAEQLKIQAIADKIDDFMDNPNLRENSGRHSLVDSDDRFAHDRMVSFISGKGKLEEDQTGAMYVIDRYQRVKRNLPLDDSNIQDVLIDACPEYSDTQYVINKFGPITLESNGVFSRKGVELKIHPNNLDLPIELYSFVRINDSLELELAKDSGFNIYSEAVREAHRSEPVPCSPHSADELVEWFLDEMLVTTP